MLRCATFLMAVVAGCGTTPAAEPASRSGATTPPSPQRDVAHAASTPSCDDTPPAPPPWALTTGAPVPSGADLTGMWIPVSGYTTAVNANPPPGPVEQEESCFGGYQVMTVQQQGRDVTAVWAFREPASGALRVDWHRRHEVSAGSFDGSALSLDGVLVNERGSRDSVEVERECHEIDYRLSLDRASGHLIGNRAGHPIRLAPFVLRPRTADCGAPPP